MQLDITPRLKASTVYKNEALWKEKILMSGAIHSILDNLETCHDHVVIKNGMNYFAAFRGVEILQVYYMKAQHRWRVRYNVRHFTEGLNY